MFRTIKRNRFVWLGAGLGVGLVPGLIAVGLWPQTPVEAVATDRYETFAMATGAVDEEFEAVYFLDFLTGDLGAVVLARQGNAFSGYYTYNVLNDLGVDPSKNPRFMMVTGVANRPRGGGMVQPSLAVVYVAEITTGKVAAYQIPWSRAQHTRGGVIQGRLAPVAVARFRAPPAGGAGPAGP